MKRRDDDAFGRKLREAGAAVTPPASEPLHARVMADVRRERAAASSAPTIAANWWWMVGAAAAAVAVVITVWVATSREPSAPPVVRRDVPSLPSVPPMDKVVVERVEPLRAKLHEARFGYLDRDSKRLAHFLIRAVPGVPSQAKEDATRGL